MSYYFCILLSLFLSCKSTNVESYTKVENYVSEYLNDRYSEEFEILEVRRANAPGEVINSYEVKLKSKKYNRRSFYVSLFGNEKLEINKDEFPIILLEEAFLETLDIDIYKDFPVVMEVEGKFVMDELLTGINSIEDAKGKLGDIQDSSWGFFMYLVVEELEEKMTEVEDMVINLLRQVYKVLPAKSSATAYIYNDPSLTEEDLQPNMDEGMVDRTPMESKVYEEWVMGWTPVRLEKYDNGFQSVVKNREVIPY